MNNASRIVEWCNDHSGVAAWLGVALACVRQVFKAIGADRTGYSGVRLMVLGAALFGSGIVIAHVVKQLPSVDVNESHGDAGSEEREQDNGAIESRVPERTVADGPACLGGVSHDEVPIGQFAVKSSGVARCTVCSKEGRLIVEGGRWHFVWFPVTRAAQHNVVQFGIE